MFTKENILEIGSESGATADYPSRVERLKQIGVHQYIHNLFKGSTTYFSKDGGSIEIEDAEKSLSINGISSIDHLKQALKLHKRGETDFETFCQQMAISGVASWLVDLEEMEIYYKDNMDDVLLEDKIDNR